MVAKVNNNDIVKNQFLFRHIMIPWSMTLRHCIDFHKDYSVYRVHSPLGDFIFDMTDDKAIRTTFG